MIRSAEPGDFPALCRIAASTDMFLGEELDHFTAVLREHLSDPGASGASLLVAAGPSGDVGGAVYFAPEPMAQGVMNLLFIGVAPEARRGGLGAALVARFDSAALEAGARLAIIETASDPMFAPAWALYRRAGYAEVARVQDYYADGLDKLIFRKRLA